MKKLNIAMLLVLIGVILISGCATQTEQEKTPAEDKIDPVAGGVAEAGIVIGEEISEEIGEIGKLYPVNNIPPILVPSSHFSQPKYSYLKGFQVLDLKYENGKVKFCIKNSERDQLEVRLQVSAGGYVLEQIPVSASKNKKECYESTANLEEYGLDVKDVQIRIFR